MSSSVLTPAHNVIEQMRFYTRNSSENVIVEIHAASDSLKALTATVLRACETVYQICRSRATAIERRLQTAVRHMAKGLKGLKILGKLLLVEDTDVNQIATENGLDRSTAPTHLCEAVKPAAETLARAFVPYVAPLLSEASPQVVSDNLQSLRQRLVEAMTHLISIHLAQHAGRVIIRRYAQRDAESQPAASALNCDATRPSLHRPSFATRVEGRLEARA